MKVPPSGNSNAYGQRGWKRQPEGPRRSGTSRQRLGQKPAPSDEGRRRSALPCRMQGDRPQRLRRSVSTITPGTSQKRRRRRRTIAGRGDQQQAEREPSRRSTRRFATAPGGRVETQWLNEDEDGWIGGERPGNCDPLSLPSAELVRVTGRRSTEGRPDRAARRRAAGLGAV